MDVTDTFNRTDNATTLGTTSDGLATWVTYGPSTWGIVSNQATCESGSASGGLSFATVETSVANGTVQVVTNTTSEGGLSFRATDANNYWFIDASGALFKVVAGSFIHVGSFFAAATAGQALKAVISGSSISVYYDATLMLSASDSFNSSATQHGLQSALVNGTLRLDSFSFVGSAGPPAYRVPAIRARRNQAVIRAAVR